MSAPYDYKVLIDQHPDDTACQCGDCEWSGTVGDLNPIKDCSLTPGDPSPAGRCPECDTLAYIVRSRAPLDLVREMAAVTIDGDIVNGEEHMADGNDEEIDKLYGFVHNARALLNMDDPKGIDQLPKADKCGICDFPLPPTVLECPSCHADLTAVGVTPATKAADQDDYRLQHEFDNEPSYIFGPGQSYDDQPVITVAPGHYDLALRLMAALDNPPQPEGLVTVKLEGLVTLKLGDTGKTLTLEIDPNGGAIVRRDD